MIVAFGHRDRVGKDTACAEIAKILDLAGVKVRIDRFAADIYTIHDALIAGADWDTAPYTPMFVEDVTRAAKQILMKFGSEKPLKVRELLRYIGARGRQDDPDIWANKLAKRIMPEYINLIADLRFKNEASVLKNIAHAQCALVNIIKSSQVASDDISEHDLDKAEWNYVIHNDGTLEEYLGEIRALIIKLNFT